MPSTDILNRLKSESKAKQTIKTHKANRFSTKISNEKKTPSNYNQQAMTMIKCV